MPFNLLLRELEDEAAAIAYLNRCGDGRLLARVRETAEPFDEDVAQYASGAIRRYSNAAGNEEWLGLMTALGASDDPGRTCLIRILDWALLRDAAELRHESCGSRNESSGLPA